MTKRLLDDPTYLRSLLDANPSPVFIMDGEACILDANLAAIELLETDSGTVFQRPCGEVLHCLHQRDAAKSCGKTPHCKDCLIRNSVMLAMQGNRVVREKTELRICKDHGVESIHVLVTAAPFAFEAALYVLLILEDITEVVTLRRILPICANCKKIRNDQDYWEQVENYLRKHTDLRFTHGICPECVKILYPEFQSSS
jgi:PAS domain-containing protein